jgi:hypothetical protein
VTAGAYSLSLFNIPDVALLDHPIAALLVGAFGALLFMGIVRRVRRMATIGVIGLTITVGVLVWQLSN